MKLLHGKNDDNILNIMKDMAVIRLILDHPSQVHSVVIRSNTVKKISAHFGWKKKKYLILCLD